MHIFMHIALMPEILRINGNLIFMIHTDEHGHPHVTIYFPRRKNFERMAKVQIKDQRVLDSVGFGAKDLKIIKAIVKQEADLLLEAWHVWVEGKEE